MNSVRRSGRRDEDPPLPFDEYTRQLSRALPFGTQSPYAFEEAETFYLKTDIRQLDQAGVNLAGTAWRQSSLYTVNTTEGAKDPYTLGQPPPPLLYRDGHYEEYITSFNVRRGFASDGSLPPATQAALDAVRLAEAAGQDESTVEQLREAVPWYHNLTATYQGIALLSDESTACGQGTQADASWLCAPIQVSHLICGHPGTIQWTSPTFFVREDQPYFRVAVFRSGGGLGRVTVRYDITHLTTDASDVTPVAPFTASQTLIFEEGIIMLSFIVTINDDQAVEENEEFLLFLANPTNGASIGAQGSTKVTIEDDDAPRLQASECVLSGPNFAHPLLPGMIPEQLDPPLPQSVVSGVAGLPIIIQVDIKNATGRVPVEGASSWRWEAGGIVYEGESVSTHRWLVESADLESQISTQQYPQAVFDDQLQASSAWSAMLDSQGAQRKSLSGYSRMPTTRGFAVYAPLLAATLKDRAQRGIPKPFMLGGIDFSALYNLHSLSHPDWEHLERSGRYTAVTVPHRAGRQRTHVWHAKPGGLLGEYFTNANLNGEPAITRVDYGVNFTFAGGEIAGRASDFASVRWEGGLALGSGSELDALLDTDLNQGEVLLTLALLTEREDQVRLWINHQLLFDTWGGRSTVQVPAGGAKGTIRVQLHAMNRIRLEWRHMTGDARAQLLWRFDTSNTTSVAEVPASSNGLEFVPAASLFSMRAAGLSPVATKIFPGLPSAGNETGFGSIVEGMHLRSAIVGKEAVFQITSRDKFGNSRGAAGKADTYEIVLAPVTSQYSLVQAASRGVLLNGSVFAESPVSSRAPSLQAVTTSVFFHSSEQTHVVRYKIEAAGLWEMRVLLVETGSGLRQELLTSPVQVAVRSTYAAASTSMAVGRGLHHGEAGIGMPVAVRLRDMFFNLALEQHAQQPDKLRIIAQHPRTATHGDFIEWYGSDYFGEWMPTAAGSYQVHVQLGEEALPGSPFGPVVIIPTQTSAEKSFASGPALQNMTATQDNSFVVHVRDAFGNVRNISNGARDVGSDNITAAIPSSPWVQLQETLSSGTEAASKVEVISNSSMQVREVQLVHVGDDLYRVTMHPFKAGAHELLVHVNGKTLGGSPFSVFVEPGPVVAAASIALPGNGTMSGIAGLVLTFTVQVRDGAGNDQYQIVADDLVTSTIVMTAREPGSDATPPEWRALQGTVRSLGAGLYEVSYAPLLAGEYSVTALVSGAGIKNGTIYNVTVEHAAMSSRTAVVSGSQTTTGTACETPGLAGEMQTLNLLARDEFGNDATRGGDDAIMMNTWHYINGSGAFVNGSIPQVPPTDNPVRAEGGAQYTSHRSPTVAGKYHTEMLLAARGMWIREVFATAQFADAVSRSKVSKPRAEWAWPDSGPSFTRNVGADLEWSARWSTALLANMSGRHTFILSATDSARFSISEPHNTANALRLSDRSTMFSISVGHASGVQSMTSVSEIKTEFLELTLEAGMFYFITLQYATDRVRREEQHLSLRMALPGSGVETWRPRTSVTDVPPSLSEAVALVSPLNAEFVMAIDMPEFVRGSSHSPQVLPAAVHPESCLAQGSGLTAAVVDQTASFTVKLSDEYKNLQLDQANSSVVAIARWVAPLENTSQLPPPSELQKTLRIRSEYTGNAEFTLSYVPKFVGQYVLSVAVNAEVMPSNADARLQLQANLGFEVAGSPFELQVFNSEPTATTSSAFGDELYANVAGLSGAFNIQVRDSAGNNLTQSALGGVAVRFEHTQQSITKQAVVSYLGGGLYSAKYLLLEAGRYDVHIVVSGAGIAGSPFGLNIAHTLADATTTTTAERLVAFNESDNYDFYGGKMWPVAATSRLNIVARDVFGNTVTRSGDDLVVRITGPAQPYVTVQDSFMPYARDGTQHPVPGRDEASRGRYDAIFQLPLPGRYRVDVSLASGTSGQHGLLGEYWDNVFMNGHPMQVRVDTTPVTLWSPVAMQELGAAVNMTREEIISAIGRATPTEDQLQAAMSDPIMRAAADTIPESTQSVLPLQPGALVAGVANLASVRWSGFIKAPAYADYTLYVWVNSAAHVFIDEHLEIEAMGGPGVYSAKLSTPLRAGQLHAIRIEYRQLTGAAYFAMAWSWQGEMGISSGGVQAIPPSRLFPVARPIQGSPFVLFAE